MLLPYTIKLNQLKQAHTHKLTMPTHTHTALDFALSSNVYICLERNVPVLCFGDGMEITLTCDTNSTTPSLNKNKLHLTSSFG